MALGLAEEDDDSPLFRTVGLKPLRMTRKGNNGEIGFETRSLEKDVQCNGDSILFCFFDSSNLCCLVVFAILVSVIPMNVLILLPATCRRIDGMP